VAVLSLVTLLLAAAATLGAFAITPASVGLMALAMGAENAVFEENGNVRIGLAYMTGALVKVGQRLATAATGGGRFAWAPFLSAWPVRRRSFGRMRITPPPKPGRWNHAESGRSICKKTDRPTRKSGNLEYLSTAERPLSVSSLGVLHGRLVRCTPTSPIS
jgi:hypothetical protein